MVLTAAVECYSQANGQRARVNSADEYDNLYESVGSIDPYATQWFDTAMAIIKKLRASQTLEQFRSVIKKVACLPNGSWDLPLASFIKEARRRIETS